MLKKTLYACVFNLIVVFFISLIYLMGGHIPYCVEHTPVSITIILTLIHITATLGGIFTAHEEDN